MRKTLTLISCLLLLSCKSFERYTEEDGSDVGDVVQADGDAGDMDDDLGCLGDGDCTDGNPCNGEETCDVRTHACEPGTPPGDGFVCGSDPRQICLEEECQESLCGDGFVDTGAGESCEPPGEGNCTDECVLRCESDLDCEDDGNVCNGEEYCDLSVNLCDHRDPLADGTVCNDSPRRICLSETCQDSICGDGYVDTGASPAEECDDTNTVEGDGCDNDCTYSCHGDGECDDGHDCTADTCDTASTHTCDHTTLSSSTLCRASAGDCDVEETCNGTDLDCPGDGFLGSSTVCRAAVDECDVEEICTGTSTACPTDVFATSGTTCDDGNPCTETDQCDGAGSCTGTPVSSCCEPTLLAGGGAHSCTLLSSGGIKCWGSNGSGQLGDGTTSMQTSPVDVTGLGSGSTELAAGRYHTCAVLSGGGVECWGNNGNGRLGDGTTTGSSTPVSVTGLSSSAVQVALGTAHTCALLDTGGVQCWGQNLRGQLGRGGTTDSHTPVNVSGLSSGVTDICAGLDHSCAVLGTGGIKCWGDNQHGELGTGSMTSYETTPRDVSGLAGSAVQVACGVWFTCAVLTTGGVQCWGYNGSGQLGDGTTTRRATPAYVSGLTTGASAVSTMANASFACALLTTGGLSCWGRNSSGQLGNGSTTDRHTPVGVSGLSSGATHMDCGMGHACAATTAGEVKCWGGNSAGQLGIGTTSTYETTPQDVTISCI